MPRAQHQAAGSTTEPPPKNPLASGRCARPTDGRSAPPSAELESGGVDALPPVLSSREQWLSDVLAHCQDIIIALDRHGVRRYESPAVKRVLGYEPSELIGTPAFEQVYAEDLPRVRAAFARSFEQPDVPIRVEYRARKKDGSLAYMEAIGVNLLHHPDVAAVIINARDVSLQKLTDPLTGLASRMLFCHHVARGNLQRAASNGVFAVVAVGVDRFHEFRDNLEPDELEGALVQVARRLESAVDGRDVVGRLDRDTFGVYVDYRATKEQLAEVLDVLRAAFHAPFRVGEGVMAMTASLGVAPGPDEVEAEEIVRRAEAAVSRARARGRAQVELFNPALKQRTRGRMTFEAELRAAVDAEQLVPFYQPIVDVRTRQIRGFEALVRWPRSDGKIVLPGAFIPIAEEMGLIAQLDRFVVREACGELARWRRTHAAAKDLFINVNLSAHHFATTAIVKHIERVLVETGLPATALELEITETALLAEPEKAAYVMQLLCELGVRFGLDDFGTGYSSLGYLRCYPFHTLKIARDFIRALAGHDEQPELVRAIVHMARALKLAVVAEGVASRAQLARLRELNCDYVQGYLFSRAVPAAAAEKLFCARPAAWDEV